MIATRLLSDPSVSIYAGGKNDIVQGKVDVRVLAVIAYLRESFGSVTVSSLISGHRLYARPGVISAHIAGHAVDIADLGGTPIQGHQEPGGMTERAVRDILLLPAEVMPRQVISLLGMGGPSFPLARPLQPHPYRVLVTEIALRRENGTTVCERCVLADTALARMKGLLGKRELPSGDGILLKPASSVHMAFMRFAIDAVFLDRELRVMKVAAGPQAVAHGGKPWGQSGARAPRRRGEASRPQRRRSTHHRIVPCV